MADPVRTLWSVVMAGSGSMEDRLLLRARTPNEDLFADNDAVGEVVTLHAGPGEWTRFGRWATYDDCHVAPVLRRRGEAEHHTVGQGAVVWVKLEDGKAFKRLGAFHSGPTLLLREGGSVRRYAVWALDRSLPLEWIEKACKRLAYHLGAKQKWAHPEAMWLPVPGSTLRHGRESRPLLVRSEVCAPERVYTAKMLVGRLKDPPPPRDWTQEGAA